MTRPGDRDWLPKEEHIKRLPKKRMASGVLFFNEQDELLLVKPVYKEDWILPGGTIEAFESPSTAAIREVQEELGIELQSLEFIGVIHTPRKKYMDDVIHFYFIADQLDARQLGSIKLRQDELSEYKFFPLAKIPDVSRASFIPYIKVIIDAIHNKQPVLIEHKEENIS